MSLQSWLQNSWLVQHRTTPDEIKNLLGISDRDLAACQVKQLPADWRCAMAGRADNVVGKTRIATSAVVCRTAIGYPLTNGSRALPVTELQN